MGILDLARRPLLVLLLASAACAQEPAELPARIRAAMDGGDRRTIEAFLEDHADHPLAEDARHAIVRIEADDEAWQRARKEGDEKSLRRYLARGYGWHIEAAEAALAEFAALARREAARQRAAEARSSDDLFVLLDDLPEAAPVLRGKIAPRQPVALDEVGDPLTLRVIKDGEELAFSDIAGAIAVYDVQSGDRRRSIVPGHRRENVEPIRFLMDDHQRRVVLWEGRKVELIEFPSLDDVKDFKMARGVDLVPRLTALTGSASLVVPGIESLRVATEAGMKTVKVAGTIRALWGAPNDEVALCWRELRQEVPDEDVPVEEAETTTWTWQLSRCRADEGRWAIEDVGPPLEIASARAPVAHFSAVASMTLVAAGASLTLVSTRNGAVLAAGELQAAADLIIEGLTPEGRFIVLASAAGDRSVHRAGADFPCVGTFVLPLPRGHVPAYSRYHSRGDRFVTISGDGAEIAVFGPPGQ